jgi:hypothetical protein
MLHPSKAQWWVIGITAAVVCLILQVDRERTGEALGAIVGGGIAVWQLSPRSESEDEQDEQEE